ncbi:anti-virulence regulator CigR family protein [Pseudomonas leptonychotis]|uniref:RcnB family protein n=1 Tax=Pseudomonas leptonychotis TaxID=2448482 RepID=A0A4T2A2Y6_9PSED|nr:anti-virulence regulator CigR family protein [Pseudomonas leptonychotis]TIH09456.1 hypothetical protein D8779_01735 [Pseudomonas leptonychotis]
MSRSVPVLIVGLSLALSFSSAYAAPKHEKPNKHGDDSEVRIDLRGPSIDIGQVRILLGNNRDLIAPAQPLPPGIRKNLARGKPLPPGIAKRLDNRLLGKLPHYDGYEWRQAGTDMVLVALASGLIYEILDHVLD